MNTKHCKKCDTTKTADGFSKCAKACDGRQSVCKACKKAYRDQHKDKQVAYKKEWHAKNAAREAKAMRLWRVENSEARAASKRQWNVENKDRKYALNAKARAAKIQRSPTWSDITAVALVYAAAGANDHVDHIIPLQGKLVSGLHVASNLQVIPAKQNLSKNNRFDPNTHEEPIWHHS